MYGILYVPVNFSGKTICIEFNSYLKNWILVKHYYDGDCFKMTSTVLGVVYNRSFVWYLKKNPIIS